MIVEIREEARGDLHVGYRFYEEQAAGLWRSFLECRRDPDWIHKRLRPPRDA